MAVSIARPTGLNVALTAAAATGHDCGHGPAGHASEGALSPFVDGGYHHAVYGADVVLEPLNLCAETLDAIRNHSWNRPAPMTPEGEVVAWADRIAYVCHDFEDAVRAGIVRADELPAEVADVVGTRRSKQLDAFITSMLTTISDHGVVGMQATEAEALAAFRSFNFERIYLRAEAVDQADRVIELLRPHDLEVTVSDPYLDEAEARRLGVRTAELDALLRDSDLVSLHAPLTERTRGLIDGRRLALLRDGAWLVNTARGALVDHPALVRELVRGRISAVLDVTEPDVLPAGSPLFGLDNVVLTPHIAGAQGNELYRLADTVLDELARYAAGLPLAHPVTRADLDRIA